MTAVALLLAAIALGPDDPKPAPARPAATAIQLGGFSTDDRKAFVWQVSGLNPKDLAALVQATRDPKLWPRYFTVHARPIGVKPENARDNPPLPGSYKVDGPNLQFQTRFPPENGMAYDFAIDLTTLPGRPPGRPVEITFEVPPEQPAAPSTLVVRVSPVADLLPENLLKFYIEFNASMSRGEAYEHLHLLDAAGKPIDLPFLELGEELWDRALGVRFTLLFDPGRVKTGLKPREEAGPVLEAGKSYTLVVDKGWHDATGRPLKQEFRKTFRVGPADTTPPDPKTWRLELPLAGTKKPLIIRSPEPLDRWILNRALGVRGPNGQPLLGLVTVNDDEKSAAFLPDKTWAAGRHELVVDTTLEDLAGNSIGRPFEVDVFQKVEQQSTSATASVPFEVSTGTAPGR